MLAVHIPASITSQYSYHITRATNTQFLTTICRSTCHAFVGTSASPSPRIRRCYENSCGLDETLDTLRKDTSAAQLHHFCCSPLPLLPIKRDAHAAQDVCETT